MSKELSIVDLPSDVLKLITKTLMDDPDREFHKIFHHTQNNNKDREILEYLFSGTYIPNIKYYYVFEENIIPWESKIIENYLNNSFRRKQKNVHQIFVSLYIKSLYQWEDSMTIIIKSYDDKRNKISSFETNHECSYPLKDEFSKIEQHVRSLVIPWKPRV